MRLSPSRNRFAGTCITAEWASFPVALLEISARKHYLTGAGQPAMSVDGWVEQALRTRGAVPGRLHHQPHAYVGGVVDGGEIGSTSAIKTQLPIGLSHRDGSF